MMTINDILKALECCSGYDPKCEDCSYRGIGMCESVSKEDAVLYLKEYKNLLDSQKEENPPLTWDELRTMKGKPVWMERPEWEEWLLVSEIDNDKCEMYLRDKWGNGVIVNGRNVGYWQAYQKEK